MSDYSPVYLPAASWSASPSATVTGGTLAEVSGNGTVGPAGAGSTKVVGVFAFDAATGSRVTIHPLTCVHEVTAAAGITAGATLKAAAAGQVTNWVSGTDAADLIVGRALTTVSSGAKVRFVR